MKPTPGDTSSRLSTTLGDIAAFVVEHEHALDLMQVVDYVDLYQQHVDERNDRPEIVFEEFVRDAVLLEAAAAARRRETGLPVTTRVFAAPA